MIQNRAIVGRMRGRGIPANLTIKPMSIYMAGEGIMDGSTDESQAGRDADVRTLFLQ